MPSLKVRTGATGLHRFPELPRMRPWSASLPAASRLLSGAGAGLGHRPDLRFSLHLLQLVWLGSPD